MRDLHVTLGVIKFWLMEVSIVALLLLLVAVVLRALGVNIPIHNNGHVELAYLSGALYLIRK